MIRGSGGVNGTMVLIVGVLIVGVLIVGVLFVG
ncbi:MAG: hypothetical protein QOG60_2694, partial [Frankiaceae bacterium]|nr:hypothetical protein [Frankiaceae bacterium]